MCPRLSANYVSCCPPNMAQVSVWAGNLQREVWIEIFGAGCIFLYAGSGSPPAREVWIEILYWEPRIYKEKSPPAREVWIEIVIDRDLKWVNACRLPRGRCGLKFTIRVMVSFVRQSPPAREVWIEILPSVFRSLWGYSRLPRGRCGLKCEEFLLMLRF